MSRKLVLAPVLCAALLFVPAGSPAEDVPANRLGQVMSDNTAQLFPMGNPPDHAGPPAGAGSGRRIR
jgi:hypothetical protein